MVSLEHASGCELECSANEFNHLSLLSGTQQYDPEKELEAMKRLLEKEEKERKVQELVDKALAAEKVKMDEAEETV